MTTRITMSDLDQQLLFRHARTHSSWQPIDVPDELLERVYELSKWAPTAANTNPLRILFVKSPEAKERLKPHLDAGNVNKTMAASVTAIFAYDAEFYEKLPILFPHVDARSWYAGNDALIASEGMNSSTLQAAYFMLAARGLGLDCGPMGGFDAAGVKREFFADVPYVPNFLCNLGYGDPTKLHPRNPRLTFADVARII